MFIRVHGWFGIRFYFINKGSRIRARYVLLLATSREDGHLRSARQRLPSTRRHLSFQNNDIAASGPDQVTFVQIRALSPRLCERVELKLLFSLCCRCWKNKTKTLTSTPDLPSPPYVQCTS